MQQSDKLKLLVDFGNAVRLRRQALGLSQEELAFRSGIDRTYIGGVERGERNLSLKNIARIAAALNFSIADLLKTTENQ